MFRDLITGQHSLCGFLNAGNRVSLLISVARTCTRQKKSALSSAIALGTLESFHKFITLKFNNGRPKPT